MARVLSALLSLSCLVCMLLVSTVASADASSRLGLTLQSTVSGNEMPALVIEPAEQVKSLTVKLKRNDKRVQSLTAVNVGAGQKKELKINQEHGRFTYDGHFEVKWGDGESSSFDMRFTMTRVSKLALTVKPEDVDLDARKMTVHINNPAQKAELFIYGKDKKVLLKKTVDFNGAKAGSDLDVRWNDPKGDILYMDLKVYDVAGFWKGVRLTPFSISIPHDDVEFDFGKWNIRKSEEHKLKSTMGHIDKNLEEHGTLLTLKLYVAGYTDTVGSKQANKTLSHNRARSIAQWFRRNGLKIPIFYQGFGEEVLAKQTPDETPEPANRRALYILSSQTPSKSGQIPSDSWRAIK
jgi:outer membrane protein OmpA-like peptidoglycan-associated protein